VWSDVAVSGLDWGWSVRGRMSVSVDGVFVFVYGSVSEGRKVRVFVTGVVVARVNISGQDGYLLKQER